MSPTRKRKPFAQWLAVLAAGDLKNLRKHIFHGHHNSGDKKPKKHSTTIMAIISSSQL